MSNKAFRCYDERNNGNVKGKADSGLGKQLLKEAGEYQRNVALHIIELFIEKGIDKKHPIWERALYPQASWFSVQPERNAQAHTCKNGWHHLIEKACTEKSLYLPKIFLTLDLQTSHVMSLILATTGPGISILAISSHAEREQKGQKRTSISVCPDISDEAKEAMLWMLLWSDLLSRFIPATESSSNGKGKTSFHYCWRRAMSAFRKVAPHILWLLGNTQMHKWCINVPTPGTHNDFSPCRK